MIYSFDTRIRFSEIDENGFLRFDNFINYFQDCSTFQSEDLGIGVEYLRKMERVWVVSFWQVDINKYPRLGDKVTVGTFAYDFKSFLGYRNFFMQDENGEYLAKANSIWALLDTKTGRPCRASAEEMALYGIEERLDMDYKPRKITIPDDVVPMEPIEVKEHHLDVNHHVNNGQYITIAASCINEERRPTSVRVEYRNQARLKDVLYPYTDGRVVDLRSAEGTSYCVVDLMY